MRIILAASLFLAQAAWPSPVLQMNKAFQVLTDLNPYLSDKTLFSDKKNEKFVEHKISELEGIFRTLKADELIKEDLFTPSYALITENLSSGLEAMKSGKKDYAYWRLKELKGLCLDCHTRLPLSHPSSFNNNADSLDTKKFKTTYDLGVAQLIVRRYVDAKASFTRDIDDKLIKKDFSDIIKSFRQVLLMEMRIFKDPNNMLKFIDTYLKKNLLPKEDTSVLMAWQGRLKHWLKSKSLAGLKDDKAVEGFLKTNLRPLHDHSWDDGLDVDVLLSSGLLSNYLFENPRSNKAPEILFWLGWGEKYLKRQEFFGSGDLFLKECIRRYPSNPVARKCYKEYKESVEFEFTGSSGTHIPAEILKDLESLHKQIK